MISTEGENFQTPTLTIHLDLENTEQIEVVDDTELTEEFKKTILSPYLTNLYDALVSRTSNAKMGITKAIFLEVILINCISILILVDL